MNEELLEKARQLRAAGVPVAEIEKYLASKSATADDTVEQQAGYPERLATTVLKGAQVIPGMKSLEALAGSLGSKFTDNPVSYSDAKAGLEEQTGRMKPGLGFAAELASSPVMAPLAALGPASWAQQGALYGGASQALDINPDESLESRLLRTGVGAAGGALLGKAGSGVAKFIKSPPGTTGKVLGKAFPRLRRASEAWDAATAGPPPTVRPKVRLGEASAPKVEGLMRPEVSIASESGPLGPRNVQSLEERLAQMAEPVDKPNTLEGFLGNDIENLSHAGSEGGLGTARADPLIQQLEEIIAQSPAKPAFKPRGATKSRFEWFAERQAARKSAAPSGETADLTLEDLLRLNNEHVKQGGSLKSAADALKIVRHP